MITLLKILGLIFLTIIAIKMAPVVLGILSVAMSFVLSIGAIIAGVVVVGGLVCLTILTALAPLWAPALIVVGMVALICRLVRGPKMA